jgi:hypothetical protein
MGHEARTGARRTLTKVEECIELTNGALRNVDAQRDAYNAFTRKVGAEFETVQKRLQAQGSWCDQNEQALAQLRDTVLPAVIAQNNRDIEAEFARRDIALLATVDAMTIWQRLAWLFFGIRPDPVVDDTERFIYRDGEVFTR